jgi:hypothetical protein
MIPYTHVRHKTAAYTLGSDRLGNFFLLRHSDRAAMYFQGDDATLWDQNMTQIESIKQLVVKK